MAIKIKYNPYKGVDFAKIKQVNAISHEHIYIYQKTLEKAWNRGIRFFANLNYSPSSPPTPLRHFSHQYIDWKDMNTIPPVEKVMKTYEGGFKDFVDKDGNNVNLSDIPYLWNAEHANLPYDDKTNSVPTHYNVLGSKWGEGTNITEEESGVTPKFRSDYPVITVKECMVKHADSSYQQFKGKVFGTMNHSYGVNGLRRLYALSPQIFQAMEIYNGGYSTAWNAEFRKAYDTLLSEGYILFGTSVVDWQGGAAQWPFLLDWELKEWQEKFDALSPEEKAQYDNDIKKFYYATRTEVSFDRGCNVLLVDDTYETLPTLQQREDAGFNINSDADYTYTKDEMGLDMYRKGQYYASGLGHHRIERFDVNKDGDVVFKVSDSPSKIILKSTTQKVEINNTNVAKINVGLNDNYVRGEAYYYNDENDMDFIYTNPIFFDIKGDNTDEQILLLLD